MKETVCYEVAGGKYSLVAYVSAPAPTLVDVYGWVSAQPGNVYAYPDGSPKSWRSVKVGPDGQEFKFAIETALSPGRAYDVHVSTRKAGGPTPAAVTSTAVTGHSLPIAP
ncbi:hypothetical protein [Streptomyces sp. WAC06614]|uniref:hypothetical protein n=1 Tax=Streptomyces sp. WAC06614 TaxID=2487416 RepID=UPI000F79D914|nr:hypothetical protein [Streptomyces sp. WAC06614]RSS66682.1 hypothetical protein EF918_29450 [Streptomyces sp. WAC06614]